ncbi:MAG: hypothetical protein ISS35_06395 [Kiritimatiellae bacterium]|nr:hypothetical protein [Kiritimatiellia bacterium]
MNDKKKSAAAFNALGQASSPQSNRESDEFWSDFRAHARYRVQEESLPSLSWFPIIPRRVLAMASMALLLSIVGVVSLRGPSMDVSNQINSLEVVASHGGVLIMEDESSHGTIVWIMDLENNDA